MQKDPIIQSAVANSDVTVYAKWQDYSILIKARLTFLVVFSAMMAYLIVAKDTFSLLSFMILAIGGFSITGAANALNQALEKDYDKMMSRTSNRPVATGRMSVSEAVLIGGLLFVLGITLLAFFNPLAAVLGAAAVVSYAFIYTPMKRSTPMSVFVGAIPGALPTMIAVVAAEGSITPWAVALFGIQFFWQFPHFWSIGYLGYNDYKRAGFRLVPELNDQVHPNLGLQSTIFTVLLIPCILAPYLLGLMSVTPTIICLILTVVYGWFGWSMQEQKSAKAARHLMFASFFYLPLVLIIFYLGTW